MVRPARLAPSLAAVAVVVAACGGSGTAHRATGDASRGAGAAASTASTLRLGYFANVTHAAALVGIGKGLFQRELGTTRLATQVFKDGPTATTALLAGDIDAAFVGPNPAINGYVRGDKAIRLVSGAAQGGAALVVAPSITTAAQLRGKTIADPQLGNTQDVALRTWLNANGLPVTLSGGAVRIAPTDNATTLQLFQQKRIDGAWVPEPWVSRLVLQGGGHVLVDEKSQWPQGRFATTVLVVRADYLRDHPAAVKALVAGELDAIDLVTQDRATAASVIEDQLTTLTGKPLKPAVLTAALQDVVVTADPAAATLQTDADHAVAVGTLKKRADLHGLVDLALLDQLLAARGKPAVGDGGLGRS